MIRHVVAFRFADEIDGVERARLLDELRALPASFPQLRNLQLGENTSDRDQRFSHAFVAEVATQAELDAYLTSDGHESFVAERFRPLIAERAIVSFEVADSVATT